ncbi:hypothetical protein [Alysiella crassa]|uniref:Uncharacterized protein n=1 Tax=Alysiella crassa TaxID=153491 RepID=A0A376BW32_9NEIS|nr:hypothetical protein [Alysiella crassa]UOP06615.1 hypothetical protein LVJ80_12850 [Alysiella crassa]SSY81160.1 Uncharacterised protein [Alysiella crassa]
MNHFDNIGFVNHNETELNQIIEQTCQNLTAQYPHQNGWYGVHSDPSGAELWFGINHENGLENIELHFNGICQQQIGVNALIQYDEQTGAIYGWANGKNFENGECVDGDMPLVFCVPDFFRLPENLVQSSISVQLCAFAEDVKVFENQEEFDKSQENEEMKWATQAFITSGMFVDEGVPYQPYAILNGIIQSFELKTNFFTKQAFYHCTIQTLGMELDAVFAAEHFSDKPLQKGNIVQGTYYLSGKVLPDFQAA